MLTILWIIIVVFLASAALALFLGAFLRVGNSSSRPSPEAGAWPRDEAA